MLLGTSVIVGTFLFFLVSHWLRKRNAARLEADPTLENRPAASPASIFMLDRPSRWLAIRSEDPFQVQAALELHNPAPCLWLDGFSRLGEKSLFISPAVRGWVFVIGPGLLDPCEDAEAAFHFIMKLSRSLGAVQMFSLSRILNHHAWIRVENERVYRAYVWAGETLWNQGERTAAEKALRLRCVPYAAEGGLFSFSGDEDSSLNSEKIWQLASQWSLDPMNVDWQNQTISYGISGEIRLT